MEYEEASHLERVVEAREPPIPYYMPHHDVLLPEKQTTKLRIVVNASSPTSTCLSLSDVLMKGQVREEVFETVSRLRRHEFAFTTEKMYKQLLIDPGQRDLLRILWRPAINAEASTCRWKTVTDGTSSAPVLAVRALQKVASDEGSRFPMSSGSLMQDVVMGGAPDVVTARKLRSRLPETLGSSGVDLREWSSNSPGLLTSSKSSGVEQPFLVDELAVKTLGVGWKPFRDPFVFKRSVLSKPRCKKREVPSVIACAGKYDPLKFLDPVTSRAKIFLKRVWQPGLDWDELPDSVVVKWSKLVLSLKCIGQVEIARSVVADICMRIDLHAFVDASEDTCGAAVCVLYFYGLHSVWVILAGKSRRVEPIQVISNPTLELCDCVPLSQLVQRVHSSLGPEAN